MSPRMNRAGQIGAITAIFATASVLVLPGCEGLDYSAHAQGTGIQIIGAVIVLAKYHASPHQKAVAQEQAQAAYFEAAKPVYEKRRTQVQSEASKKIAALEREIARNAVSAGTGAAGESGSAPKPALTEEQKEKERMVAKVKADAAAELASLDNELQALGSHSKRTVREKPATAGSQPAAVPHDHDALAAAVAMSLPPVLAVTVPPEGQAAEHSGTSSVMLVDPRNQRLVGDDVIVLNRTPRNGATVKVEGVKARVVSNP